MHSQDTIPLQAEKHHGEPTEEQPAKEHELKAAEEPQQNPVENQFEQPKGLPDSVEADKHQEKAIEELPVQSVEDLSGLKAADEQQLSIDNQPEQQPKKDDETETAEQRQTPIEELPGQPVETLDLETTDEQPQKTVEDQPGQPEPDRDSHAMENRQLKSAIESLLFIAGNPISLDRLKGIFEDAASEEIEAQLDALGQEYDTRGSGIMLAEVAGGYQLATRPENAVWIRRFRSVKVSSKLSKPALETLAIVAYKQPITRSEVEAIRGVNIGGIMRNLMERRLVKIVGKKDVPGKPMMYGTSLEFLQYFGLKDLSSLPTLKEFQELEAGEEVMEEVPAELGDEFPAEETPSSEEGTSETATTPLALTGLAEENGIR